jgi:predicted nucleic acid-binding protein
LILVDTNVLLDIITEDATWSEWSLDRLETAGLAGPVFINPVVFAELATRFERIEALDLVLSRVGIAIAETPRSALFFAAKAFVRYRRAGGVRTGVLPDFFIGAHAAVLQVPLLTRDARRYRTYFPTVEPISP